MVCIRSSTLGGGSVERLTAVRLCILTGIFLDQKWPVRWLDTQAHWQAIIGMLFSPLWPTIQHWQYVCCSRVVYEIKTWKLFLLILCPSCARRWVISMKLTYVMMHWHIYIYMNKSAYRLCNDAVIIFYSLSFARIPKLQLKSCFYQHKNIVLKICVFFSHTTP